MPENGMSRTRRHAGRAIALLLLTATATGCASTSRQTQFMEQTGGITASKEEMRLRANIAAERFATLMEEAATRIEQESDDPEMKKRATLWKMNTAPAVYRAAFRHDPLLGMIDLAALSLQLRDFVTTGDARERFGSWQPVIVTAIDLAQEEILAQALAVIDTLEWKRPMPPLKDWARAHPIKQPFVTRQSIAPELFQNMGEQNRSALASVGSMADELDALSDRMVIYADALPRMARWQAEWMLENRLPSDVPLDSLWTELRDGLRVADEVATLRRDLPDLVLQSLVTARPEIATLIDSVRGVADDALRTVGSEVDDVTEFIHRERVETLNEVEALAHRLVSETRTQVQASLAELVWPTVIGLLLFAAMLFWLGVISGRLTARRAAGPGSA